MVRTKATIRSTPDQLFLETRGGRITRPDLWIDAQEDPTVPAAGNTHVPKNLAANEDIQTSGQTPTWDGDKWICDSGDYWEIPVEQQDPGDFTYFTVVKGQEDGSRHRSFTLVDNTTFSYLCQHNTEASPPFVATRTGDSNGGSNVTVADIRDSSLTNDYVSAHLMKNAGTSKEARTEILLDDGTTFTETDTASSSDSVPSSGFINIPGHQDLQLNKFRLGLIYRSLISDSEISSMLQYLKSKFLD